MRMRMTVTLTRRDLSLMLVPMMLVMRVSVFMDHRGVPVFMLMYLSQMQPHAKTHQRRRRNQVGSDFVSQNQDGYDRPYERRRRKIGSGPGGSYMSQRQYEQTEAHAIAKETYQRGK